MKKILITGVGGFIGSYLAHYFEEQNYQIYGIDIIQPENIHAPLQSYYQMNLINSNLIDVLQTIEPHYILHCAGRASVNESMEHPDADFLANVVGTQHILESIRISKSQAAFIFFSSAAVYGNPGELPIPEIAELNPLSPYGYHKLIGEKLCHEYNSIYKVPTAIARIFSAYGTGLHRQVIWDIIHKFLTLPEIELWGTGNESRDFIHVRDIAGAIDLIMNKSPLKADIYNIANQQEITITQLAQQIAIELQTTKKYAFNNIENKGNPNNWRADISKLKELGYTPDIDFKTGIQKTTAWAKAAIKCL
ncbi:NAD(P)-dependent oxidoreductase [Winogradskyella sp.]|nr:NAD(P)-dependent oxidoreductase [Winogradskyella sp.]